MLCGLAYAALALPDQDTGPVRAPVVMVLARRWWERHRDWAAGAAAGLVGSLVVFALALLGPLRAHLDRLLAVQRGRLRQMRGSGPNLRERRKHLGAAPGAQHRPARVDGAGP